MTEMDDEYKVELENNQNYKGYSPESQNKVQGSQCRLKTISSVMYLTPNPFNCRRTLKKALADFYP